MQMANCSVDVHRKRQLQVIALHGHDEWGVHRTRVEEWNCFLEYASLQEPT